MQRHLLNILTFALCVLALASCSTTSRLGEHDVLYTGVKKLKYNKLNDSVNLESEVKDQIFQVINVKPNNPLYSPYWRTPFPIGLWVYNHMDPKAKGFKGWFYKTFSARPVLISRVKPDTRVQMIDELLHNNGYFGSYSTYTLNYSKKNPKKASITYNVNVSQPYPLGTIGYVADSSPVTHIIDSLSRVNRYLKPGNRYSADSLNQVRIDITNRLRNRGYYYFKPEYIEYLADSVTTPGTVNLQMVMAADIPNNAIQRYLIHDVTVTVYSDREGVTPRPDTVQLRNCRLIKMQPVNVKNSLIESCIRGRQGRAFRVGMMDRTQLYLSRTGIFSTINMDVVPLDTVTPNGDRMLDLNVTCQLDKPLEIKVEVQGTSKSNSYIGPALVVGIKDKNLSGGGEQLSANITGSYEWQTGRGAGGFKDSNINSYEFGADISLAIPRLLAPKFVDRSRRYVNWTKMSINGDILNRPRFFKMLQLGAEFTWEWHANKHSLNTLTPFKLTYNKLLSQTVAFDSTMQANRALALSFQDVFIPQMSYSYTYDNTWGANSITWSSIVSEAGNVFSGIWALARKKNGEKKLLGTPFSQFVKAQTQLVWSHRFGLQSSLVGRVLVGAAYAYGNSTVVPYREQFYIGGANSLRGFAVRSVGPGTYRPEYTGPDAYYDQVGTFKFETNLEYRFPIIGYFKGAVFLDAGNVWSLEKDDWREGAQIGNFFKELAVSTGVGLRFDMDMLVLRVDFGYALHAPYKTKYSGYFNMRRFKDAYALHIAIGYPF